MTRLRTSLPLALPLAVAVLALAVAFSGTAYSVSKVSGNSLIKKHSLSGNRLKPDSVKGAQVDESSLGTVPDAASAARAARASVADSVPPPALTPLAFAPGWFSNPFFTARQAGFRKDVSGFVHLQGGVGRPGGGSSVIATLPPGFRATDNTYFLVHAEGGVASVRLDSAGQIVLYAGSATFVSLEGITFYPDH